MFVSQLCSRSFAFVLGLVLLAGCAQQPLSSIDRSKYKTVALDPDITAPDHYVYRDITGKRFRGIGLGLLYPLLAGLFGAKGGRVSGRDY